MANLIPESWPAFIAMALDVGLKSTALLLLCLGLTGLAGKRRPLLRSTLWNASLIGLLALPALSALAPRLRIHCLPALEDPQSVPASRVRAHESRAVEPHSPPSAAASSKPRAAQGDRTVDGGSAGSRGHWMSLVAGVYVLGSAVFAARLCFSLAAVSRLRRSSSILGDGVVREKLEKWRLRLRIDRAVDLASSDAATVPIVIGWLRPAILLPAALVHRESEGLHDAALLHELAHVRRSDYLWQVILRSSGVLYWWHPLFWAASRLVVRAREEACDDFCLYHLRERERYRSTLLEIAALAGQIRQLADAPSMARPSGLDRRLDRILQVSGVPRCLPVWPVRALAAALVLSISSAAGSLELARDKADARVDGVVLGADGRPLPGALVRQAGFVLGPESPGVKTDSSGRFVLEGAVPGASFLVAEAEGHAPAQARVVAGKSRAVELRLGRGGPLRLRVLDGLGRPIFGALVSVTGWGRLWPVEWESRTDAEGRVSWSHAPLEGIRVGVQSQGHRSVLDLPLSPSHEEQKVILGPPLRLRGSVRDAATGQAIPKFDVIPGVSWREGRAPSWIREDSVSRSGGRFELTFDFPYPFVTLRVEASGYRPLVSREFRLDEGEQAVEFALSASRGPRGLVVDEEGEPVQDAEVILLPSGAGASLANGRPLHPLGTREVLTGPDGTFELPPREPGAVVVVMHEEGYAELEAAELDGSPDIHLRRWARIEGLLCAGGKALEAERIRAVLERGPGSSGRLPQVFETTTGEEGAFTLDRVPAGEFTVSHEVPFGRAGGMIAMRAARAGVVETRPGETASISLGGAGAALAGRVAAPSEIGAEIDWAYATVSLQKKRSAPQAAPGEGKGWLERRVAWQASEEGKAFRRSDWQGSARVREDGSFRFEDVPPGEYLLSVILEDLPQLKGALRVRGAVMAWASRKTLVPAEGPPGSHPPASGTETALDLDVIELQRGSPGPLFPEGEAGGGG